MRQKSLLQAKSSSARAERKNWVEPLRKWILDSKRAGFLAGSTNYAEIREFARSFGTNPALHNKTISISFCPPSDFARTRKAEFISSPFIAPSARLQMPLFWLPACGDFGRQNAAFCGIPDSAARSRPSGMNSHGRLDDASRHRKSRARSHPFHHAAQLGPNLLDFVVVVRVTQAIEVLFSFFIIIQEFFGKLSRLDLF